MALASLALKDDRGCRCEKVIGPGDTDVPMVGEADSDGATTSASLPSRKNHHGGRNANRAPALAAFLVARFGLERLRQGSGVVDVSFTPPSFLCLPAFPPAPALPAGCCLPNYCLSVVSVLGYLAACRVIYQQPD